MTSPPTRSPSRVVGFVLVGMILGRLDLGEPTIRRRVLGWSVAVTVITEAASRWLVGWLSAATPDSSP